MSEDAIQRILQARKAIKAKEFDKAKKLLKGVDHPKAREWLARLEKQSPKRKLGFTEFTLIVVTLAIVLVVLPSFFSGTQQSDVSDTSANSINTEIPPAATATARPLTDPLARYIFTSVSGIERIEGVNSLSVPGRDETQYDFTVRLLDDADMNTTLEAISAATGAYRTENNMLSTITFNVLVVQRNQTENWRYSGSQWFRRAIDGALVTATPYPTRDPNAVVAPVYVPAQNQSNAPSSTSYQCDCSITCPYLSHEEAQFQLNVCGCKRRDADNDGIACEED
jgi:hypothetical protein